MCGIRQLTQPLLAARDHCEVGTRAHERVGDGLPNAGAGSRDERDLTGKLALLLLHVVPPRANAIERCRVAECTSAGRREHGRRDDLACRAAV